MSQGRFATILSMAGRQGRENVQTSNFCLIPSLGEHLFITLMAPGLIIVLQAPGLIGFGLLSKLDAQHEKNVSWLLAYSHLRFLEIFAAPVEKSALQW